MQAKSPEEFHAVNIKDFGVSIENAADGVQYVTSAEPLSDYPVKLTDKLVHWATETPDTVLVSQRGESGEWESLTFAETLERVRSIASWMLTQNLSNDRPVVILSGNSTEHLLVALASMYIGVPFSPISTAYSLISSDYGKLRHVFDTLTPGLIFTDNLGPYRDAIDAVNTGKAPVLTCSADHATDGLTYSVSNLSEALNTAASTEADAVHAGLTGDAIAKFLWTSGSTGMPKAVINTQQMICANQEMVRSVYAFLKDEKPVILDWLPWNHTFGGNQNIGMAVYNGGTFYIDEGKPVPKMIHHTLENLKEISPTIYFNVPKGYELMAKELKANPEIAKSLFKNLKMFFFAGAGLAQHVWDQLDELSVEHTGKKVPMVTGLGATETAPSVLFASVTESASGVVGSPAPGIKLKLLPNGDKTEIRVKAVTITPGYWRKEEQTKKAYDEEGYYCLGDAVKWIDPAEPNRGLLFDGRVSEDFKLDTGTWVSVGALRASLVHHFAPYVQDAVICGRDRGYIAAMIFPDWAHLQALVPGGKDMDNETLVAQPHVKEVMAERLEQMAGSSTGSSTRVKRITILTELPSIDGNEITDKGSINQRAVMSRREGIMNSLYEENPADHVISL